MSEEFAKFADEFNEIINKLNINKPGHKIHDCCSIFYELGTTQEIKEKLVTFASCMLEIYAQDGITRLVNDDENTNSIVLQ